MNRIILDQSVIDILKQAGSSTEICDASWLVVGVFLPEGKTFPDCTLPDEELKRRSQEKTGRPLAEILRDLKSVL